jgi:hypothetical protein
MIQIVFMAFIESKMEIFLDKIRKNIGLEPIDDYTKSLMKIN